MSDDTDEALRLLRLIELRLRICQRAAVMLTQWVLPRDNRLPLARRGAA